MAEQPRTATTAARSATERTPPAPRAARAGGSRRRPTAAAAARQAATPPGRHVAVVDRCGVVARPAGAQPVDLLAGAEAQPARPDPLQPDLPDQVKDGNVKRDLLDRRLDPGHVQEGGQVPVRRRTRADDQLLDPDPVVRQQPAAVRRCSRRRASRSTPSRPNSGPSFLESLLFGFGPTLLLVLLFVFIMRRAAARRRRRRADVVRPLARAPRRGRRPARSRSTTSPGSTRPRRS